MSDTGDGVLLSKAEAKAVLELLDMATGGNVESVFAWDGRDDPTDPGISGCAKLFRAAGRAAPAHLKG
jgi:hypothetical protein